MFEGHEHHLNQMFRTKASEGLPTFPLIITFCFTTCWAAEQRWSNSSTQNRVHVSSFPGIFHPLLIPPQHHHPTLQGLACTCRLNDWAQSPHGHLGSASHHYTEPAQSGCIQFTAGCTTGAQGETCCSSIHVMLPHSGTWTVLASPGPTGWGGSYLGQWFTSWVLKQRGTSMAFSSFISACCYFAYSTYLYVL